MKISVVIPLYNETEYIKKFIHDISKYNISIIIVDDGSETINTNLIRGNVTLLTHKVNLGKGAAMTTGSEYAFKNGSEAVIFMDADGQHSPDNLKQFIPLLRLNKYDVIFGSRELKSEAPLVRRIGNKMASILIKLFFGIQNSDPLSGFRGVTKSAFSKINWESSGYGVELEMLVNVAKRKLRFVQVPIKTIYHDKNKGVSVLDAFGVLLDVLKWRLSP